MEKALVAAAGNAPEGLDILQQEIESVHRRQDAMRRFSHAYQRYCWEVDSLADLRLAHFHIMASEGKVHASESHLWHMGHLSRLCEHSPLPGFLFSTATVKVDLSDPESVEHAISWWSNLTEKGGEGMVVKPASFTARGPKGLLQPAIKVRGKEYLRIIYGPDYDAPENLSRLRNRNTATKRRLALSEFALGIEGLERFVAGEPLRRVHECAFGVLAMESEAVDPRL
jgi:protein phosphatase